MKAVSDERYGLGDVAGDKFDEKEEKRHDEHTGQTGPIRHVTAAAELALAVMRMSVCVTVAMSMAVTVAMAMPMTVVVTMISSHCQIFYIVRVTDDVAFFFDNFLAILYFYWFFDCEISAGFERFSHTKTFFFTLN